MMNSYDAFAPTQQEVEGYKEKLQNSKAEQKNLFLIIFQVKNNFEKKIENIFTTSFSVSLQLSEMQLRNMDMYLRMLWKELSKWINMNNGL